MKKLLSVILAALMLASAASVAVSAEIIYTDDFEEGKNEEFWGAIGAFVVEEDGKMRGFSDAKIAQSQYEHDETGDGFRYVGDNPASKCYKEFTVWVETDIGEEADTDFYAAGLWLTDTDDVINGIASSRTIYNLLYCAKHVDEDGNERYAYARLSSDNPQPDADYPDNIYGELDLPEAGAEDDDGEFVPGFNMDSEAVKLGIRYGKGNITGYANGKIVASYNYETIGIRATPIVFTNFGCIAAFDNFGLGTYDENVKKFTRNASYTLAEADVSVSNGVDVNTVKHTEDETVTVTAPAAAEAGKSFDKWTMKIGGREVADVEAAKLLHGIEIGDLSSAELTFTMPNENVELVATYKEAAPHAVKVNEGTASAAEAVVGTTVTVTANAAPEGKIFDKWEVVAGGVALENANAASTTFVMVDADVELTATYKEGTAETHKITVTGGSANVAEAVAGTTVTVTVNEGSELEKWEVVKGGVTLADATAASTTFVMGDEDVEIKAVVKGGDVLMGDADGNGKVNAKDIIAVMRSMLGNTPENFNEKAADMDANGKINAKDIIAIMRKMLEK